MKGVKDVADYLVQVIVAIHNYTNEGQEINLMEGSHVEQTMRRLIMADMVVRELQPDVLSMISAHYTLGRPPEVLAEEMAKAMVLDERKPK